VSLFKRKGPRAETVTLFFATDIHGSEPCFRKWVNAAGVYNADMLILGGDVTGKFLVPLVEDTGGTWRAELSGEPVEARDDAELAELEKNIRRMGRYPVRLTPQEQRDVEAHPEKLEALVRRVLAESLESWVALAEERLSGPGTPCFMMLGNDDYPELADTLRGSPVVTYAEDGAYELPGGFELASIGYSTPTPWDTPRELPEEDLAERIEEVVARLSDPRRAIFNFHCPPRNTHLDQAPKLDDTLRPVVGGMGVELAAVGSTAVREAIERYEPVLGLHGHVHESPAGSELGSTLCINPGSEYSDGVLRGAIVELEREGGVKRWQLVHG
jgi:uncharacterized protein